ncbi:MAG: NAD(+)/NADH kinase [Candidatus Zixiibacteriota bacterium]
MRFGLIANLNRPGAQDAMRSLIDWVKRSNNDLLLSEELLAVAGNDLAFARKDEIASKVDVVVSMGGDGTILSTNRAVGRAGTPILGINLGSLGFLTQLTAKQLVSALEAIVAGKYNIEERMLLEAHVAGRSEPESAFALNDIVVDNGPVSRLIDIVLEVNGEEIVAYRADGLVVSTPTGSTAYNLAVGGPIMNPTMDAVIVAPISAFSLSTRPMILSPGDTLELKIGSQHGVAGLTLDGQVMVELKDTDRVTITRADFRAKFVVFPENTFYKLLRDKLHWGVTPRGQG